MRTRLQKKTRFSPERFSRFPRLILKFRLDKNHVNDRCVDSRPINARRKRGELLVSVFHNVFATRNVDGCRYGNDEITGKVGDRIRNPRSPNRHILIRRIPKQKKNTLTSPTPCSSVINMSSENRGELSYKTFVVV